MSCVQIHTIHDYLEYQGISFENYESSETLSNITNYIRNNNMDSYMNSFDIIMVCLNEGCSEDDYGCFVWDGENVVHPFYNGEKGSDVDYMIDSSGYFPNTLDMLDNDFDKIRESFSVVSCRNRFEKCVGWTDLTRFIRSDSVSFITTELYSDRYAEQYLTIFKFRNSKIIVCMLGDGSEDDQQEKCLDYIRGNKPYVFSSDFYGMYDIKNNMSNIYDSLDIDDYSDYIHLIIDPDFTRIDYDSIYTEPSSSTSFSRYSKRPSKGSRKNYIEYYNNAVHESVAVEKCSATTNKGHCCNNKAVKKGLCQTHFNSMRNRSRRN
jgi:hypothetical protein